MTVTQLKAWIVTLKGRVPLLVSARSVDDARYRAICHYGANTRSRAVVDRAPDWDSDAIARGKAGMMAYATAAAEGSAVIKTRILETAARLGASAQADVWKDGISKKDPK